MRRGESAQMVLFGSGHESVSWNSACRKQHVWALPRMRVSRTEWAKGTTHIVWHHGSGSNSVLNEIIGVSTEKCLADSHSSFVSLNAPYINSKLQRNEEDGGRR